ncbi:MAG: HIT family hydrolase [Thermoprotei archaeon]|nr:MAG: HIT family hydrolase [Thermoprotei archaeon]
MKNLWAPWRIKYVKYKALVKNEGRKCFLCEIPKENRDKENFIIYRGKHSYAVLNIFPYNNGHTLVAPYRHVVYLGELNENEVLDLLNTLNLIVKAVLKAYRPDGFNIGINIGKAAGAGEEHLHIHVVPRWHGDTNFMAVLAETKVIPEGIYDTYENMRKAIEETISSAT